MVRLTEPDDVHEVIDYEKRNGEHFARWETPRDPSSWDIDRRRELMAVRRAAADNDTGYGFIATFPDQPKIVARASLTDIARGGFQAATLGFTVDAASEGRGLAYEAVSAVLELAFGMLALHRVAANYQPINERSGRLLKRLGFVVEGYARDYLFINGAWRDHVLTALVHGDSVNPT